MPNLCSPFYVGRQSHHRHHPNLWIEQALLASFSVQQSYSALAELPETDPTRCMRTDD